MLANFYAEESDFVRFNGGRVRQAGGVETRSLSIDLIHDSRHASARTTLAGDLEVDPARLVRIVEDLRDRRAHLPEDPHLLYSTEVRSTERRVESRLPSGGQALAEIETAAGGRDLVGIYAAGGIYQGFANSLGQRNWYANGSFNLDWSFVHSSDK